jgi:hypothetical protein
LRAFVVFLALVMPGLASAKSIGLLVTGEHLKAPTQSAAEKWLRARASKVVTNPLPADAVNSLLNCFVLDDPKCMRSVVDARSTTDILISIRIDVAGKKHRDVRLTIDWFVKGSSPVSSRRNCDKCTEAVLRSTLGTMLDDLTKTVPGFIGRLKVSSKPQGITVLLDGRTIGVTPLETEVPVGDHEVQLARDGRTGEPTAISVTSDEPVEVELKVPALPPDPATAPPPQRSSRLIPGLLIGLGVAAVGTGTTLYLTSEEPTGKAPTYRDTKNLGIGVAAGGAAFVLTGVIIVLATRSSSAPTMALTTGGATVGWAGTF